MCSHTELAFMTDPPTSSAVATNLSPGIPDERFFFLLRTSSSPSICSSLKAQSWEDKLGRVIGTVAVGTMSLWWISRRTHVLCGSPRDPQRPSRGVVIKRNTSWCLIHRLKPPQPPSTILLLAVNKLIRSHYLWCLTQMESFKGDSYRRVDTVQSVLKPTMSFCSFSLNSWPASSKRSKIQATGPKVSPFKEKKIKPHHEDQHCFSVPKTPTKWNKYSSTFFFFNVPSWKWICVGLWMISPRSHWGR